MHSFLRQSTASQSRTIGPFIDSTDFLTPKTGLTIANTDIKFVLADGTAQNKNSGGGTHKNNGCYNVTFNATDTAQVGELHFSSVVSGALPVFGTYFVLEEAVFDALCAASAAGFGVAQTGDSYAIANSVSFGNSALKTLVDAAVAQTLATALRSALGLSAANTDTQLAALAASLSGVPTANQNADALLARNVAGGSSSGMIVSEALYFLRCDWNVTAGVLTVRDPSGNVAWSKNVTSDDTANPIVSVAS